MSAEFDLNLLPYHRLKGQESTEVPGLTVSAPPRRAARGREEDHLLVYLVSSGHVPVAPEEYNRILSQVSQSFYKISGSLTLAVRSTVETVNQTLLNRNLRASDKEQQLHVRLILGALRGNRLLLAQSGPIHVFHLSREGSRPLHDLQMAGRGLGIGQAVPLYLAQSDLRAGDLLVLCPDPPEKWEASLLGERRVSLETLRYKLPALGDEDVDAVLIQAEAGSGLLNILEKLPPAAGKPQATISTAAATAFEDTQASPSNLPTSRVESERPASRFTNILSGANLEDKRRSETPPRRPGPSADRPPENTARTAARPPVRPNPFVAPRVTNNIPEIDRPAPHRRRALFGGLAKVIRGMRKGAQSTSDGLDRFMPNLLPGQRSPSEIPGSSMAIFAIVIPVIIIAIAGTVYLHYGRTARYQQNYELAVAQAAEARGQTSPTDVRHAWDSTIYYLDLAEQNQVTEDSENLRQEAQTALDNLDGILRLDFRAALVGATNRTMQISRLAATDTDLYMLDALHGNVLRAFMTEQGYEIDQNFKCDPGQYDANTVGALIDLEALPMNNIYNARVMAIDSGGNLLYCGLADPVAVPLVAPSLGWRGISAFALDSDGKNLFVLDAAGNAVWQYAGTFGQFSDLPIIFFGEQVPQDMDTAIDVAANNADLYLLFQDGHVTSCPLTRYAVSPMRCADPATFIDTRPERQPGSKINDAIFTQMTFASAPDPSLYLLEPLTHAVYRFSPRSDSLELRSQFRASMEQNNTLFNGPATAMTIGPNRYIFLSVDDEVLYATDVP